MTDFHISRQVRDIFGERALFSDIERACYSYDATGISVMPDAVVFPETEDEVEELLKLANSIGFPVIPRGAGSGFSGGSVPVEGGIVLSFERMNRIIDIDEKNMVALVEPGVILEDLRREVGKLGLFYPPDPASKEFCTIGGNVAECAGGPSAFKYGVTKDYVLALRNAIPSGGVIQTGVRTVKGVVGYNLTGLIVGSEGTLTVVTEATLRLLPHPESFSTVLAAFNSTEDASRAVNGIVEARIMPAAIELIDQAAIECVREYGGVDIREDAGCYLLVELDGFHEDLEQMTERLLTVLDRFGAVGVESKRDDAGRERLWSLRRAISPSLVKVNPKKINEDITVPRTRLPDMMGRLRHLSDIWGIPIVSFGHAGDGNIHVNIMIDDSDSEQVDRGKEIVREIFEYTVEMGGTISGEHGVGISKKPYLSMELSRPQIELMKKVKTLFDPNNILNPHKIFPDRTG